MVIISLSRNGFKIQKNKKINKKQERKMINHVSNNFYTAYLLFYLQHLDYSNLLFLVMKSDKIYEKAFNELRDAITKTPITQSQNVNTYNYTCKINLNLLCLFKIYFCLDTVNKF